CARWSATNFDYW
nr:immunoglobulin heavy chain junction region [Macaca mulatta]